MAEIDSPSVDDFIENRWEDAKEALRKLDPEFVDRLEMTARAQAKGLVLPGFFDATAPPRRRLSKDWHTLLEKCHDLDWQAMLLEVSAEGTTARSLKNVDTHIAGARSHYNIRSWFVQVVTLGHAAKAVIRRSLEIYMPDQETKAGLRNKYSAAISSQIVEPYRLQRNLFIHPDNSSWAQGITEDGLWEGEVSIGLTPRLALEQFHLPAQAQRAKQGNYDGFANRSEEVLLILGQILHDFEQDLATHAIPTTRP